ncbi:pilin biogenesis protein [Pseudoalteromonas sp. MB41]|uniref:pilus assembly protein n=1 Tax=unclassified Pseudoalteromonas TaxID=194690 RepID=UPI0015D54201|nr:MULTISPECIES: PilC/PilY family type IV pilus protein [unclassified Pseudoalteromonas]MCC9659351.1 pilin biogenesis protein [Pseudoalteromonas sp. MB41]QLJ09911.1 pilin biogenesis protein [Pseudoalteromonas sp. JSTW]
MKMKTLVRSILTGFVTCMVTAVYAEDIELYVNYNVKTNEKPRVLLIFDTSGSMAFSTATGKSCGYSSYTGYVVCPDSRLGVAKSAITSLVDNNDDIDFGLMRFNSTNGGYVLAGIGSSSSSLKTAISVLPADGGTPLTETLWEAYLYITGQSLYYGEKVNEAWRDTSVETKVRRGSKRKPKYSYTYISPFDTTEEAKRCDNSVNVIYMTDGDPSSGSDNEQDGEISDLYKSYFGSNLSGSDKIAGVYLHKLAQIIHGTEDVKVDLFPSTSDIHETGRVYTIGFGSGMSKDGKRLLSETADLGGGQYLHADTAEQLSKALKNTITRIREVNDTFTSPSIANNNVDQTRSREGIYYAMFYPETGARWRGNLKKLKVSGDEIVDLDGKPALNADGLIAKGAKTFWLPDNTAPDGNIVQEGGANLMLSNLSSRTIYTDAGSAGLVDFTKSTVSTALGGDLAAALKFNLTTATSVNSLTLGLLSTELDKTIKWSRGIDVDDEDGDGSTSDQRQDIFGDPLHSKPVTIDYGNDDVRILIGTNAGYLHFFQDKNDVLKESWAFIPSSLYKIIKPLRENQEKSKVYGVDGPISVFFDDKNGDGVVNGTDRVWAFFGLRRGGNNYYGLDITNPDSPRLMWGGPIIGGTGDFKELAQSWSKPTVTYINLKGYENRPLLVFGAGYDTNKDNVLRTEDTKGRGIYIVDAQSGKKVWALTSSENGFAGKHSIASDISVLDSDYDGYTDRLYASDTGGDVWRIDMPSNSPTSTESPWTHFKLASLGSALASQDRRFFYKPMVARTMFSKVSETDVNGKSVKTRIDTPFDAVLLGSGNRSKPTGTTTSDQLFMIRDINTVTRSFQSDEIPAAITQANLMNMDADPFGNALDSVDKFTDLEVELGQYHGWYYNLLAAGEKSLAASTVIGGVAYFTSYAPASSTETANQCSLTGGSGSLYAFHLHYGTKVYDSLKFTTSNDVPDTPQLYFGVGDSCVDSNNNGFCDETPDPENPDPEDPNPEDPNPEDPDPDNPDVIKDTDEKVKEMSQFLTIGPGLKGEQNPFKVKEIQGPGLTVKDGKIQLVNDATPIGFGFKTQQTYIYKREVNDKSN